MMSELLSSIVNNNNLSILDEENIIDVLKEMDDLYANIDKDDDFEIPDSLYDQIYQLALIFDPSNEYFSSVGSSVRGGKVDLPQTMGSLNQLFTDGDICNWIVENNLNMDDDIIITAKYDGNACLLIANGGDINQTFSRGNGYQGADTTRHMIHIMSNYTICEDNIASKIKGEVICKKQSFPLIKNSRGNGVPYKNPRNMVAGLMNRDITDPTVLKHLSFIAFSYTDANGISSSKSQQLEYLKSKGFQTAAYVKCKVFDLDPTTLTNYIRVMKQESEYELDGIVIDIDDNNKRNDNGELNPSYSFKFKENTMVTTVEVTHVEYNASKDAFLKPTICYKPVMLGGTECKRTAGFNAGYIRDNNIGPGTILTVIKSGDVIPYIIKVNSSTTADLPLCKYTWTINDQGIEVDAVAVDIPEETYIQRIAHFAQALKIPLFKEGTAKTLFDCGYKEIEDIIKMREGEWELCVGSNGVKIFNSMQMILNKLEEHMFAYASGLLGRGIGSSKLKEIVEFTNKHIYQLNEFLIDSVPGFTDKTTSKIISGLSKYQTLVQDLNGYITFNPLGPIMGPMSGMKIVFTGFRNSDLESFISKRGGEVKNTVTKDTNILIIANKDDKSTKLTKARGYINEGKPIQIITLEDFKKQYVATYSNFK